MCLSVLCSSRGASQRPSWRQVSSVTVFVKSCSLALDVVLTKLIVYVVMSHSWFKIEVDLVRYPL